MVFSVKSETLPCLAEHSLPTALFPWSIRANSSYLDVPKVQKSPCLLSCLHPCLKSTHLLSEVSKNTAHTSHMRHVRARNNQCFHSAWLSALWSPKHSLYPHSAATQRNSHLLLVLAQVSRKRFPKSEHGRTSWVSATDIWSHSIIDIQSYEMSRTNMNFR